jgi:hypothetical protein
LLILGDSNLLPRLCAARHLKHVGKHVILRVIVDDLNAALVVIVESTEDGRVFTQDSSSKSHALHFVIQKMSIEQMGEHLLSELVRFPLRN